MLSSFTKARTHAIPSDPELQLPPNAVSDQMVTEAIERDVTSGIDHTTIREDGRQSI